MDMAFLLRVELPDVPGSLGALATALGTAGADIEAIEIVEHRADGVAVDDVLLELAPSVMPDAMITACQSLEGVRVHWISRNTAGANLSMDLEEVEAFTEEPDLAIERLVEVIPATFRTDWALAVTPTDDAVEVCFSSSTAPQVVEACASWRTVEKAGPLPDIDDWDSTILAGCPGTTRGGTKFVIVVGRHGGPEFLGSEIARLGHMVSLAASVQTASD